MENERRQYERYTVADDAYAAIGRNFIRVGKIADISIGGLAFDFFFAESNSKGSDRLDIFSADNHFNLYNLPCEVIYEIILEAPKVKSKFMDLLTTRRSGLKFISLSLSNKRKLQAFIDGQPDA